MRISKDANINYLAKVINLSNINPVEGSDNLVTTVIDGNVVVINKSTANIGDKMIYFPAECAIAEWFLSENNLFKHKEKNKNPEKAGFFEDNGRVKCIKLRGQISSGFIIPFSVLGIEFDDSLLDKEFDTVGDKLLMWKYKISKRGSGEPNSNKVRKGKVISKVIDTQFRFHIDTPQLGKNVKMFDLDTMISITRKMHGTSGISSYVQCLKTVPWYVKFGEFMFNSWLLLVNAFTKNVNTFKLNETEYDYLYSSRRVVKNDKPKSESGFYNVDIWKYADDLIKERLIKGMTMYYEIVGYLPDGKMIQNNYSYGMKDPNKTGSFEYGVNYDIYVYRITVTNVDGKVVEFNSQMIKNYCKNVGLKTVVEYFRGTVRDFLSQEINEVVLTSGNDAKKIVRTLRYDREIMNVLDSLEALDENELIREKFLTKLTDKYLEKNALDCGKNVPDEGIVVRIETKDLDVYKFKSRRFLLAETEEINKGLENIEE